MIAVCGIGNPNGLRNNATTAYQSASPPIVAASAPPLRDTFDLPVRLLIGLALGIFLAFGVDALDPVMRDRRALDRLGLPSLARIPRP